MINQSIDNDINIIKQLFHNTIGKNIDTNKPNIYNRETIEFFNLLIQLRSLPMVKYGEEARQFHMLYILGILYFDYNKNILKIDRSDFENNIYYPNMINVVSTKFDKCKKIIKKQFKDVFKEVSEVSKEIVDFYLIFYSTEPTIIEADIISKFIKGPFLDEDPLEKHNINKDYISHFRFLLYSYLQNRTANILSFDLDPSILEDDCAMSVSSRYRIYEKGLKISHIQQLCKGSETLSRISDNYDKIVKNITSNNKEIGINYLQAKYHNTVDDSRVKDNKILILKSSSENYNLNKIKKKLPLIHKILRSVHVETNVKGVVLESDEKLIYDTIYEFVSDRWKDLEDEELRLIKVKKLSMDLKNSLVYGYFIDPYTMEVVDITGHLFVRQLKTFLEILFSDMGM